MAPHHLQPPEYAILVVTPDITLGELLQNQLTAPGYEVHIALSATGAVSLVRSSDRWMHLVIVDMSLGQQQVDELRAVIDRKHPGTRFICLVSGPDQAPCRTMDAVLVKPFPEDQLLRAVRSVLGGGASLR